MLRRLNDHELAKISGGASVVTHGIGLDAVMSDARSRADALEGLAAIRAGETPFANPGEFVQTLVANMHGDGGGDDGGDRGEPIDGGGKGGNDGSPTDPAR